MDDRTFDTWAEAEAYLLRDGDLACFSRHGSRTSDCAPLAFGLAVIWANSSGDSIDADTLESAMGRVVNEAPDLLGDLRDNLHLLADHGEVLLAVAQDVIDEAEENARERIDEAEEAREEAGYAAGVALEEAEAELAVLRNLADLVLDVDRGLATFDECQRIAAHCIYTLV